MSIFDIIIIYDKSQTFMEKRRPFMNYSKRNTQKKQQKLVELSLNEKRDEINEEFAKIKREINSDTLNPDTFLSLTRKIETSKLKLVEINKLSEKRQGLEKQLKEKLRELNELWREEFNCLNEETKKNKQHK